MLSTSTIKNVSQASHYFSTQDNYYTQDEGFTHSEWWGKGSKDMQLAGTVSDREFTQLLSGRLPNGEQLGKMENQVMKHRAGWDLTFSAPKSVSIMALVAGDQRLIAAHREAVKVTLEKIQQGCGQARITVNGAMQYENTRHLTGALYHHDLSRAKDPQLHTHSVIMNMTARADGKWRSLASSLGKYNEGTASEVNGFIERVRHQNRYYSKLYETELAFHVKQCGYELRHDSPTGIFEIAAVPSSLVEQFSKRRQEIEAMLEDKGLTGGKAAAVATLSTRENKERVDREALKHQWQEEAKQHGVDVHQIKEKSMEKLLSHDAQQIKNDVDLNAVNIVRESIQQLAVFQSSFSLEQIIELSAKDAISKHCDIQSLVHAVQVHQKTGYLLPISNEQEKSMYMAKNTLDDEKALIEHIKNNQMQKTVISSSHLHQFLSQHTEIPADYHSALESIFGMDRMVLVEGEHSKTVLLEPIMKTCRSAQMNTLILSPSTIGSYQLAKRVQQQPQSLWEQVKSLFVDTTPNHANVMHFLSAVSVGEWKHALPAVLLVDQSHLLSTHQKAKLTSWAKANDAKLILFGNKDNLLSHQVSTSLHQLIDHGLKAISIPTATQEVQRITPGHLKLNIHELKNRIVESNHQEDRHYAMTIQYARLNQSDRKNTRLIAANKSEVGKLNLLAHNKLIQCGEIKQNIKINTFTPVFLSSEKAIRSTSYIDNQYVRFNDDYRSLGIKRGEYLRVARVSHHSNRIILQNDHGKRIVWRPDRIGTGASNKVEVFQFHAKEIGVGESIVLNRSIKSAGLIKGERLHVESIVKNKLKCRNELGKSKILDITKPSERHFDYGYAATLHEISHEKPTIMIADMPGASLSTHQRKLNQLLTQTNQLWIYTDDSKKLAASIARQTGTPLSATEVLARSEEIKASMHAIYNLLETEIGKANPDYKQSSARRAIDAVDYAMRHLTERQAGFTHKELIFSAMQHALGHVTEKALTDVTLAMEKSGTLLRSSRADGTFWTTAEAVRMEREIITLTRQDLGKMTPLADADSVSRQLNSSNLRSEQKQAITDILTSTDRVLSIQGRAGTGKTTMMMSLDAILASKDVLSDAGYTLRGIAPTNKAVKELTSRGILAQTIDSFLSEIDQQAQHGLVNDYSKTLFVLDEASMVSNSKMLAVLQAAQRLNFARLIPTGDIHQNPSIEAGKPHDLIQRSLDKVIHLSDIQRQQNSQLKSAALALYEHKIEQTFAILASNIIEIKNQSQDKADKAQGYAARVQMLVADYFVSRAKDASVQIIAPSHEDRRMINQAIRDQRSKLGELKGDSHLFSILTSKDLTRAERSVASNFKVGEVVRFVASQNKNIQANDYFEIRHVDQTNNLLTLGSLSGTTKEVYWQIPASSKQTKHAVEVYRREERRLQVGDQLVWMKTNKKENILSADIKEVMLIVDGKVTTKNTDGHEMIFDAAKPSYQHWDHAYALTTYSTQGGTYNTVLGFFETSKVKLMNLKTFLVTITRQVHELRIYTDDKEKLQAQVTANQGNKLSSLEVIGQYPVAKKRQSRSNENAVEETVSSPPPAKRERSGYDRFAVERIIEGINKDAEKIAIHLLGEPKVRGGHYLKFGAHQGSLSVTVKGEKQGWWHDFSEGKGGRNMLSFIQHHGGLSKKDALDFSAKWTGIWAIKSSPHKVPEQQYSKEQKKTKSESALTNEDRKKLTFAKKLAEESQPMAGTLVERYLKEHRGIACQGADIRFHQGVYSKLNGKAFPAMLVIARDHTGHVKAVQATYLDPVTAKKIEKTDTGIQKQTFGMMKGAAVTLAGKKDAPTLVAEGIETALSLKQALPDVSVKVTLSKSNFMNINTRSLSQKVVLCLDQDGHDIKSDKLILNATKRLLDANKDVNLMIPKAVGQQKTDYNDVIKMQGINPIKDDFSRSVSAQAFYGALVERTNVPTVEVNKIENLAKQLIANNQRENRSLVAAHHAATRQMQAVETVKVVQKTPDVERGM